MFFLSNIRSLELSKIKLRRSQPRKCFDAQGMDSLSRNISENGVISPITVAPVQGGYEVVCGARRVKAARQAGLTKIPAAIINMSEPQKCILALSENLHREQLNCFEVAEAIQTLFAMKGTTQKDVARKLSISQGALANKLRLLVLDDDQRRFAVENELTERHIRAAIRLPEERRDTAMYDMVRGKMNVAAAEQYVQRIIDNEPEGERRHAVIKDVRIFFNTITRAVEVMNRAGLGATAVRRDTPSYIEYIIKIPAQKEAAGARARR